MKPLLWILLPLLSFLPAAPSLSLAATLPLPKGTRLTLPRAAAGVKAEWVFPPLKTPIDSVPTRFDVDRKGRPWGGLHHKLLIDYPSLRLYEVDRPYDDFAWLSNGEFVACAGQELGTIDLRKPKLKGAAIRPTSVRFNPILRFRGENCRLHPGLGSHLYMTVSDPTDKTYNVYLLKSKRFRSGKIQLRRLLSAPGAITDVAGNGKQTYVAIGKSVVRLFGKKTKRVFSHPKGKIRDIALTSTGKLFYATDASVGFFDKGKLVEFMQTKKPRLRIRGNTLFIYLSNSHSVLKISGINKLGGAQRKPRVRTLRKSKGR